MKNNMIVSREEPAVAVRLEFHDDRAKTVYIAGSFNDWNPKTTSMLKDGSDHWIKEFALPPGVYEYLYVVDGRWVNDPKAVKSTPNPQGGRNSVLVVEQNNMKNPTSVR